MEMWSIGFLSGLIFGVIFLGAGIIIGKTNTDDKNVHDGNSCDNLCIHDGCGDRCGSKRVYVPTKEEKEAVINTLYMSASSHEKDVLNAIKQDISQIYEEDEDD